EKAKKGELEGLKMHKGKLQRKKYLIAKKEKSNNIIFYMIGTHENFYRELKKYLREVE
ncbi:type II toxin-antitoxin system RelE/ParE family toxin, partial [Candidatus Hakubella thermalkaliphila]